MFCSTGKIKKKKLPGIHFRVIFDNNVAMEDHALTIYEKLKNVSKDDQVAR